MTEEPMTHEEIDNVILGVDVPEEAYARLSAPTYNVDFQREHALRFAVETFSGQGVTTLEILYRAEKFHNFMIGKPN